MLAVSPTQIEAFQTSRREQFVWTLAVWLSDELPDRGGALEHLPGAATAAAECWQWGIQDDGLVRLHAFAATVLGPDYADQVPSVGQVLGDAALPDLLKRCWLATWLDTVRLRTGAA